MKNANNFRTDNKLENTLINEHNQFLQDQLTETQQALFLARSVKEVKFLQNRINYLKQQLNKLKRR